MKLNTEHLDRCIQTLEGAVTRLTAEDEGSIEYDIFRNASIKGFELTLETSGKLLKKALKPYFASPKAVDQLALKMCSEMHRGMDCCHLKKSSAG